MTKFLSLILIMALGMVAFLGMRIEAMRTDVDTLRADMTQLRTDTNAQLKGVADAVAALTTRVTALEPHAAVPAPDTAATAAKPPAAPAAQAPATAAPVTPVIPAPPAPAAAR